MLNSLILKLLKFKYIHRLLDNLVIYCQSLLGIGIGSDVNSSGELTLIEIINKYGKSPYIVFDVGANLGQFSNLVINNINSEIYTIHCFEPAKETFQKMSKNILSSQKIKLNNFGIGKNIGEVSLYYDDPGSGLASLTKRKLDHIGIFLSKSEKIKIDTIDTYCETNNINSIHLLKLDIEGHELDALYGAKNMLSSGAIEMVSFEFGGTNIDTRIFFQDYWYFFESHKMKIFRILPSGDLYQIKKYLEYYEQFRTSNFLAIKQNSNFLSKRKYAGV